MTTVVSRAFQILSDADKKAKFDRFGGDPDNRFGGGSAASPSSPFSGFARSPSGGGRMYEEEISPDELFNRFFGGGGMGGGFGPFGMVLPILTAHPAPELTIFQAASTPALNSSSTWAVALASVSTKWAAGAHDEDHAKPRRRVKKARNPSALSSLTCSR